jgi:hypothetical protein
MVEEHELTIDGGVYQTKGEFLETLSKIRDVQSAFIKKTVMMPMMFDSPYYQVIVNMGDDGDGGREVYVSISHEEVFRGYLVEIEVSKGIVEPSESVCLYDVTADISYMHLFRVKALAMKLGLDIASKLQGFK